ncbi:AraC family transcriptional regulator [Actinoplanes xinjiangensis]|uniref:AraC family transcriptional regulator n=2 Tax=Actinoplanes xinjiangensis TaxID=512350 RepID=A0A316F6Y8_9ACTN|nr:AraC family transcriptional regulator [Actinoplanes xinjiangensis]GIF42505.1 AraC family transcriptional regulator [Actinoplanes xinjiangensis]
MPTGPYGESSAMMRRSSVPLVGFPRQPGHPSIAVARLPGHPVHGGSHAHDFLVLFYAHRAQVTVTIDDRPWTVSDGDLFVLAPGQVVAVEARPVDGWVVWFPADVVRSASVSWRSHPLLFPFASGADRAQRLHVPAADRDDWLRRFADLDAELSARRDGYPQAALAHVTLLLVAAGRLSARSPDEPLLAAVLDVIEDRFRGVLSLADVAAAVALTPGHLTTVVRRRTGRTVQQWITQRRLQEACRLLSDTDLPVATVARRCGYPDASYFIKRFRSEYGLTPARWRG